MNQAKRATIEKHSVINDMADRLSIVGDDVNVNYPRNKCIHHLFEDQAENTPDNIALVCDDSKLTYRELERKSNQFAHYLKRRGVAPETLVGICLNRSLEMVVGILAILKAGGAYVPLDPDSPEDRITYMLEDSRCPILITDSLIKSLLHRTNSEILCYDELITEVEKESQEKVVSNASPENLAYIIYTSGSTGKPKGVMIENRNVVRLLFNERFQFNFGEHDAWTIFHSFCFDFSVWEMYGALLFGGKAVIIPKASARDPQVFSEIILKEKTTVINQTPSAFYNLIPTLIERSANLAFIKYVIFGGEKLNPAKLAKVKEVYPNTKFINMYGITETTVHVTYKEITQEDVVRGFSNIGKPIPTLRVYILNEHKQLVPIGEKGEMYVGGEGVARGYLNREELTAQKFIPDPFIPGRTIYRSGDLACIRNDGDLEYFGRIDNQVQLRGFRIELGEIESVLSNLDEIEDCVVVVNEDKDEDKRIIAYIMTDQKEVSVEDIRRKIARQLPDYMIPAFFIRMDSFPLTINGKLDVEKLPVPDIDNISTTDYSAPENENEQALAKMWSDILRIDKGKIGRDYNFFEIGGHSISVAILAQRMREKFKKAVTNRHIYENPSIKNLGKLIPKLEEIVDEPIVESDKIVTGEEYYPIISAQFICWIVKFLLNNKTSNVCEVYNLEGSFNFSAFKTCLNNVARSHDSLWYPFSIKKPLMFIRQPEQCDIEWIDLTLKEEEKEEEILKARIVEILHKPFDLTQTPLLKVAVIRLEERRHLLLVSFPHIISDIASVNSFVREVFDAYLPTEDNERSGVPYQKTSAKQLVEKEIEYLGSEKCKEDQTFWREKLENCDFLKFDRELFLEKNQLKGQKLLGKIKLEAQLVEQMLKVAAQSAVSIQVVIFALIQATLHTITKQNDIAIAMVYDLRWLNSNPPVMHMNSTAVTVRSKFSHDTTYDGLIADLKWFLTDALDHVRLPSSMLLAAPLFPILKRRRPVWSMIARLVSRFGAWYYRSAMVNRDILNAQLHYTLGMIALWLDVYKKQKSLFFSLPIGFNALPDFFENRVLWSDDTLCVRNCRDRELLMNPEVFKARSRYQDAWILNIDLTRDKNDDACLLLWGGLFNKKAFTLIKAMFLKHLESMLENPKNQISRLEETNPLE